MSPHPQRATVTRWLLLGGGLLAGTLLVLALRPVALLLPYFCFAIIASLVLPLREGSVALLVSCALSAFLLAHRPAPLPPLAWGLIAQAELWVLGTGAVVVGLTERSRRQAQAAARQRENVLPLAAQPGPGHLYSRMLDEAPDGIVCVDNAGKIVLANKQTEALFGYSRDDLLGQSVEMLMPAHIQARHVHHRHGYMADPHTRVMGSGLELFARRADGFPFPVQISLSPLETDQAGSRQVLVMAVVRDITLSKATEEALARERAERAAAEAAVAERDAFLSISAHELRTPLTSLRGYSELLTEAVRSADILVADSALPPAYARLLQQSAQAIGAIDRQSTKMVALVDKLLDVARLGHGTFAIEPEQGALDALAHDVVATAQRAYPERRIVLVDEAGDRGGRPLLLRFDSLRLDQALANVIDNAIKFSDPATEVLVRLWEDPHAAQAPRWAHLCVSDAGPGIPPEERGLVVQRFYQIKAREKSSGLGLGLWLADTIAGLHGGQLEIADNPECSTGQAGSAGGQAGSAGGQAGSAGGQAGSAGGPGTCVTLSLPLTTAAPR